MKKNGNLVVVFASVEGFLLLSLLSAQLAVSSDDEPAADASNVFLSDKNSRDDAGHHFEKDVLQEERPGVSLGKGQSRSGGGSATTAEETWYYDRPTKRQRRSSSQSWLHWHLSRRSSRTRPYRSTSQLFAAVTSMTAAIFLLWRLWNAVSRCLEPNRNTPRRFAGPSPRLLSSSQAPAVSFAECLKTEARSLSSEGLASGGDPSVEDGVAGLAGDGNPSEETGDVGEDTTSILANDGGESGGIPAQKKWRRNLAAALPFILKAASVAFLVGGIIAFLIFQTRWYIFSSNYDVTKARDVITVSLASAGVLGVFGDFLSARRGTRGTTDASTATKTGHMSPMQKLFINFFLKFILPMLTIKATENNGSVEGPWELLGVALLVLIYSVEGPVKKLVARVRRRHRIVNL